MCRIVPVFFSSLGNVVFYSDVLIRNNFKHWCCYCYFHSKTWHHFDFNGIKVKCSKFLANSHWFSQNIMKSIVDKTLSFFTLSASMVWCNWVCQYLLSNVYCSHAQFMVDGLRPPRPVLKFPLIKLPLLSPLNKVAREAYRCVFQCMQGNIWSTAVAYKLMRKQCSETFLNYF